MSGSKPVRVHIMVVAELMRVGAPPMLILISLLLLFNTRIDMKQEPCSMQTVGPGIIKFCFPRSPCRQDREFLEVFAGACAVSNALRKAS